ncbi:MAG: HWE histidine kinase domain-containing protein [Rhizomicrobium sp.]
MALGSRGFRRIFFRRAEAGAPVAEPSRFAVLLSRPRSALESAAWLVGTLAVSSLLTYLRLRLGFGSPSLPLVFFFPAIVAMALLAGWEFGLAALLFSIALVWFAFVSPAMTFNPLSRDQFVMLILWSVISIPIIAVGGFLRAALQQLIRSEARYRTLIDAQSDIVWVTDADGNIGEPEPDWAQATGMQWPDYAGRGWLRSVHEDDRASLMPASGEHHHEAEFRLWNAKAGDWRWHRSRAVALAGPNGAIAEWVTTMSNVHEPRLARERSEIIIGEARHRLKNLVTIIEALAKSSRQAGDGDNAQLDAYVRRFLGRLHALGTAADLVLAGQHVFVDTEALVRASLAPFMEEGTDRFAIKGPKLSLSEATGGSLALAVHELATNAIKYGALSNAKGTVSISWSVTPVSDGEDIVFIWKERGGPPAVEPARQGFGLRVIKSVPARERNGDVQLEYPTDGLYCRIAFSKRRDEVEAGSA